VPVSYQPISKRLAPTLLSSEPTSVNTNRFTSSCTLANFLNRRLHHPSRHSRSRHRSQSQPPPALPVPAVHSYSPPEEIPLFVPNPDIPRINQAQPSEPIFPSIQQPYQNPTRSQHRHHTPPQAPPTQSSAHHIPVVSQDLHSYYPEELFISSVLPTRTPRELRKFQDHCWKIFQQRQQSCSFAHTLDDSRRITTSPLHFQNLLWRGTISFEPQGITELYYRIKRLTRPDYPDRPFLEPAYSVTYPWVGIYWSVTQFDRPLPPRPRNPHT
jgi:hypothetical protein